MSSFQVGAWIAVAVLLFWTVGAYNRLVRLRNALVKSFGPVDERLTERHLLLAQHAEAIEAVLSNAGERLAALRAAQLQAETAQLHARTRPDAAGAISSLRLAEEILTEARARLPVQAPGGIDMSDLNARLADTDTALGFARRQFNAAVLEYNQAVMQIPTRLIAATFNFGPAGAW